MKKHHIGLLAVLVFLVTVSIISIKSSPVSSVSAPESLWPATAAPTNIQDPDTVYTVLGLKFKAAVAGTISGVKFYKGSQNTGTHIGTLWSGTGTKLAEGTFTGETASGWQTLTFATPVTIQANTTYVASYVAPVGRYSSDIGYFNTGRTSGNLSAAVSAGVYSYAQGAFPNLLYNNENYWVDVIFTAGTTPPPPDTTPPTVSISSPLAGATLTTTTTVAANAADNVGVVGVTFVLDGTTALGSEDTTSPYSLSWDPITVPNGSHSFTATARDAAGNSTTSSPVTVTTNASPGGGGSPDATPPTVSISAPSSGATLSGANVTLSATAADNVGVVGVQFKIDGANVGSEDTSSPYSISWNSTTVSNNTHTVSAVARDAAGNTGTASVINITVSNIVPDTTAPTVSITAPANGASVTGSAVTVSANASDNIAVVGVRFKLDGANLGSEDLTSPYSVSWNSTGATTGNHTLTAVARDAAGNTKTSSSVTVTVDRTTPTVSLTAPASNATVSGAAVTLSATASDNIGVAGVQFKIDGTSAGSEDTSSPYSVSWNSTAVANGTHTLTAVARDSAGNTKTSSSRTITVNNTVADATPPSVSITAPIGGATISSAVSVNATASDNIGVAGVQFKLDGVNLNAEDTTSPYSISWNSVAATNGLHTLTATARDAAGNSTTSAGVSVTVNNVVGQSLIQYSDFEGVDYLAGLVNQQHCCAYSVGQTTEQARSGTHSLRFELHKTDPLVSNSIRTEVTLVNDDPLPYGEEWVGASYYLKDWVSDTAGESIIQWHHDTSGGAPPIGIWSSENKLMIARAVDSLNTGGYTDFVVPLPSNTWFDLVFHIKWSNTSAGLIEIWKDGVKVYTYNGITADQGNYLKVGMNKFGWADGQPSLVTSRVFYVDELRVGNAGSSYAEVAPR